MYNLIDYSNNYSKTLRRLWQSYRDNANINIAKSESFKHKINITGKTLKTMLFDTITINSNSINKKFVSVTTLISNEEMNDILKIVKSLEESLL